MKNWLLVLVSLLIIFIGFGYAFGWMTLFVILINVFMLTFAIASTLATIFDLPTTVFKKLYGFGIKRLPMWIASVASIVLACFAMNGVYWLFGFAYRFNSESVWSPIVLGTPFIIFSFVVAVMYSIYVATWKNWKRR